MRHAVLILTAGCLAAVASFVIWRSTHASMVTAAGSASSTAGALAAAAPGASFAPRPLHLVVPNPPLQPGPLTAAAAPRLPKLPGPRPLAAAHQPDAAIPPSMVLAPPVNVQLSPPPVRNLAAAEVPAEPAGDPVWVERPSTQERPEIRVTSRTSAAGALTVTSGDFHRNWHWTQSGLVAYEAIEPGEYSYQLLGPNASKRGTPDQEGVLRCRRYHLYELFIDWSHRGDPSSPLQKDLGD